MSDQNSILNTKSLSVGYRDHTVLTGVSIDLQRGEVLVIIGQNGSGKSTLLKTLGGLLPKRSGEIWLKSQVEKDIFPHQLIKKGISYFVQGGLIMPTLTVQEHLELAIMQTGRKLEETAFEKTFAEFPKLKEINKQRAGNLSGGDRQILSFGILLMQEADTWFMDEPTAGLAPAMVQVTTDFLRRKNCEGVTMLIVEHNMDVALNLASNIVVAKEATLTKKFNKQEVLHKDF